MIMLSIRDIPPDMRRDGVKVNGCPLSFVEQRTGFGVRRLFHCPCCWARRAKLIVTEGGIFCRTCAPFNVYRRRCNLYDNGGDALITYHMQRLAASIGITIKWPFSYLDCLTAKPRGMRWDRWSLTMKRLQRLEGMRLASIALHRRYSAQDIKDRLSPEALAPYSLPDLERYILP